MFIWCSLILKVNQIVQKMAKNSKNKKGNGKKADEEFLGEFSPEGLNESANLIDVSNSRSSSNVTDVSVSDCDSLLTTPKSSEKKENGKNKSVSPKRRNSPRKIGRVNYEAMHEGDQRIVQGKSLTKKNPKVVQFEEDGNLIKMTAEGMDTEFMSDDEKREESEDSEFEGECETVVEVPREMKVTFFNNNSSMVTVRRTGTMSDSEGSKRQ